MKHNYTAWRFLDATPENKGGGAILDAIKENQRLTTEQIEAVKTAQQKALEDSQKSTEEKLKSLETNLGEVKSAVAKVDEKADEAQKQLASVKSFGNSQPQKERLFNDILADTIDANMDAIRNHRKGQGSVSFRLKGFEDENVKEVKAVGDMSGANFTGIANYTTDRRTQLIESPYNRVWLADILPSGGSSSGSSVMFPKENGGEGAAALWTDPTADKAQMDFDLTTQSAYFKWIAGYVIVGREVLDDVDFFTSYIQRKMLLSLKAAENDFILNGSSDTNPVSGLLDLATAYDGSYTVPVERIIDAAWGQIVEDTENFYNPTNVILTPREAVAIGLNKSAGSGEYDLPPGSVGFVNGRLTIGGLDTVTTTSIGAGNFLAFDKNALMFIRRMMPELRIFEDSTLAKKNKIMFRIEERATLIGFNNAAIVSGTLEAAP